MDIYCMKCKSDYLKFEVKFIRTSCNHLLCIDCVLSIAKILAHRKPCPCGERMEPFEGIKLTEIKIIPKYFQRLFEITEEFGKVRRNNVAARLKLMKALFNSLKYAFRAWEKYIAYIDGLGISWESTQLKPSLIKEELHSELKSHLDNLAMEFKVASYGFRDVELYGEDFRAIFPNIDSI